MSALPQPISFERLRQRYRIRAELVAASGLRVGAGKSLDAAATDQPVMRDARGLPYVPGSSLKGALRSGLEAVLRGLDRRSQGLWACELFERDRRCLGDSADDQKLAKSGKSIPLSDVLARSCTACGLFGSPFLAGRVFVHDLPFLAGAPTEVRDGVGIHRDLGTAQGVIKYDTEVVPAGSRFQLEMVLENVDDDRLALVLQTLEMLHQGEILLGGLTSRGLGKVRLEACALARTDAARLLSGQGFAELDYAAALQQAGERLARRLASEETTHA